VCRRRGIVATVTVDGLTCVLRQLDMQISADRTWPETPLTVCNIGTQHVPGAVRARAGAAEHRRPMRAEANAMTETYRSGEATVPRDAVLPKQSCDGLAPHVWGPATWAVMTEAGCAAEAHPELRPLFVAVMCCVALVLCCETCRRFYAHAWCVSSEPEAGREASWVHALHACVAHKVAGSSGCRLPEADAVPSLEEWRRRLHARQGTAVSADAILDALLFMAAQTKCEGQCDARRSARGLSLMTMIASLQVLLAHAPGMGARLASAALRRSLRAASKLAPAGGKAEGARLPTPTSAHDACALPLAVVCVAHEILQQQTLEFGKHAISETRPRGAEQSGARAVRDCVRRVDTHARGALPQWILRHGRSYT
jgi:hypothetical protein